MSYSSEVAEISFETYALFYYRKVLHVYELDTNSTVQTTFLLKEFIICTSKIKALINKQKEI